MHVNIRSADYVLLFAFPCLFLAFSLVMVLV